MNEKQEPSILVVDDEPDIRENLRDILSDLGYAVDTAPDGPSALQLVREKHYDVALLDLRMPGMDGLELYRRIKEIRAGTVAMIVTAYAADDTAQAALEAGAWKIVSKPVDFSFLLELIGEALDQPVVLVIDDDVDMCESLWDILRERGYRVCLAHDSEQAAERVREQEYQVVLIDMKLPRANGAEVYRMVRRWNPQTRTVLITGHRGDMERKVEEVIQQGANAVCFKPFNMDQLLETIQKLSRVEHES
jgi:two-component system, NtrC family, response regulator HydG